MTVGADVKSTPEAGNRPEPAPPGQRTVPRRRATKAAKGNTPAEAPVRELTRAERLTALLNTAPDNTDHGAVREYLHHLADAGLAVLLIAPGSKMPFDGRDARQRNADDRAAQEAAREAGSRNWATVKSPSGLHLASSDPDVLDGYLAQYESTFGTGSAVNMAVVAGPSGLVVADTDTALQTEAFLGDAGMGDAEPTVRSPGQRHAKGVMVHSDGGHFWFTVPDGVELPGGVSGFTDSEGEYAVMSGSKYVLIPPSTREEGPYTVSGPVRELPDWLRDRIIQHGAQRAQRATQARQRAVSDDDPITRWGAEVTWPEILEPTGWANTGKSDNCGCDIWTAPGSHASWKSATAHEAGCSVYASPDPPLHIWTDHDIEPFTEVAARYDNTVSRLRAYAAIHHDGDEGAAIAELDLEGLVTFEGKPKEAGALALVNLPEEFWNSHPRLLHIRQKAHATVNSADAVMGAVLAWLAAYMDPTVKVNTGIKKPLPMTLFVGLVGTTGTGKTSAAECAAELLDIIFSDPLAHSFGGTEIPEVEGVGSGQGLAEAFMGREIDLASERASSERKQVRHKLMLLSDEGASLAVGITDNKKGSDIGPVLRSAWSGAMLGQANASADRKRKVEAGSYSIGMCVNFQQEAVATMSTPEQLGYGTPQRFVFFPITDPSIPDITPPDPGPLTVTMPTQTLTYCEELTAELDRHMKGIVRGDVVVTDLMESQLPAQTGHLAGLLVTLCDPGRTVIYPEDLARVKMILDNSKKVHDAAMEQHRERKSAEQAMQVEARITERVATAAAVEDKDLTMQAFEGRVRKYVDEVGGKAKWKGVDGLRQQKFKGTERTFADLAVKRLEKAGVLVIDGSFIEFV